MGHAASSSEPKLLSHAKSLSLKNLGKKSRLSSQPIRMQARNAKTRRSRSKLLDRAESLSVKNLEKVTPWLTPPIWIQVKIVTSRREFELKKTWKNSRRASRSVQNRIKLLIENLSLENLEKDSHRIVIQAQNAKNAPRV